MKMSVRHQRGQIFLELLLVLPYLLLFGLIHFLPHLVENGRAWLEPLIYGYARLAPYLLCLVMIIRLIQARSLEHFFRRHIFSLVVTIPLFLIDLDPLFTFWLLALHLLTSATLFWDEHYQLISHKYPTTTHPTVRFNPLKQIINLSPAQLATFTFLSVISTGTSFLLLPISSASGISIHWSDALFLATSATCVTGLATIDISSQLSLFGQMVLLACIQIGGLGIMILYASMSVILGRSMPIKEKMLLQDMLETANFEDLIDIIIDIIKYTFVIELWGALVLSFSFYSQNFDFSRALYYGFFHSISAFCNAGFALFPKNLEAYATHPFISNTIAILIILGGLGFHVLRETKNAILQQHSLRRLSLHTKTSLVTTVLLIVSGILLIFFGEFLNALDEYTLIDKLQIAFFQSVTLRTAGFNTINFSSLHAHTCYIMIFFMFIGGCPGSTAGGIKTTTFAILIQSIRSALQGETRVELFQKSIPNSLVVKSTALTILYAFSAILFIFLLMKTEINQNFLHITFEVISALGTVGLTMGLTPYLTVAGKIAICTVMFIGRVGPLTLAIALSANQRNRGLVEYPEDRVMIG